MNDFPFIETARAKINLTLHVGPPAEDGYHPLQSLVVFAEIGDLVECRPAKGGKSTLDMDGPFANDLESDASNLILKTVELLSDNNYDFKLTKNLPIASGIGGGSADAAATARLLGRIEGVQTIDIGQDLFDLGADIPVCVNSETCFMQGKGERLTPLPNLGKVHAVLVNPGVAVSTGKVFKLFDQTNPEDSDLLGEMALGDLLEIALAGRNDLQDIAISIAPEISAVLDELRAQDNCQLARMSGSGATCFGLFPSAEAAQRAQKIINAKHPDWWCVQTSLGDLV